MWPDLALWRFLQAHFRDKDLNPTVLNLYPPLQHTQPGVESHFRGRVPRSVYRGKQRLLLTLYAMMHSKPKYGGKLDIFDIS